MIGNRFTGIDGDCTLTLDSSQKPVSGLGNKRIYVIPSDKLVYFTEKSTLKNRRDILNFYRLKIEEKYRGVDFDICIKDDDVEVLIFRDYRKPEDFYALDSEIHALARFFNFILDEDGYVLDIDKDKLTFLSITNRKITFYRVYKLSSEDILKDVNTLLEQIGNIEEDKPLMLSGNSDHIDPVAKFLKDEKKFLRVFKPDICKPWEVAAYGAALKGAMKDRCFFVKTDILSTVEMKSYFNSFLIITIVYLGLYIFTTYSVDKLFSDIKKSEVLLFKKAFPDQPVVSPYEQTKATVKVSPEFSLTKKLGDIDIPKDAKIYKIEYINGVLTLKGESKEAPSVAKSIKKTPLGNFEFEVEIR